MNRIKLLTAVATLITGNVSRMSSLVTFKAVGETRSQYFSTKEWCRPGSKQESHSDAQSGLDNK